MKILLDKTRIVMASIISTLLLVSCTSETPTDLTKESIIPIPVSITATGAGFEISESTVIFAGEELTSTAQYMANQINLLIGLKPEIVTTENTPRKGLYLSVSDNDQELGDEGYELNIGKKLVSINANTVAGCFNGIQTLLQVITSETENEETEYVIATGVIRDYPFYSYRGSMLDVARHFFDVDDVKRYIDFLAAYKMNILHLHLSDDQGWRIEIKSWPNLTTHGGSTEVGGGERGFYTQEQYWDIVRYAQERNITIIPEIDMPGHTNAALSSYAELNCNGKATKLYTGTRVGFSTLCTDKEITYKFIDDVVREISALTPGPYFHIGGDESHVTPIEDYIIFIEKVEEIVKSHGKKVVGWDEIANAKLIDNSVVQFWADVKNTTMALDQGAKVIISPAKKAYLDMQYDSTTHLGLHWAAYIEVDEGYSWDPLKMVPGIKKENILGVEAPLWSETVTNIDEIEYMVFPRLPGYAEIGWSAPETRNWDEYKFRLAKHGKRFEANDIDFYRSKLVPWEE